MRQSGAIAILRYFLQLLKLLEDVSVFLELFSTPIGLTIAICLGSYEALLLLGSDVTTAITMACLTGFIFHIVSYRPEL